MSVFQDDSVQEFLRSILA